MQLATIPSAIDNSTMVQGNLIIQRAAFDNLGVHVEARLLFDTISECVLKILWSVSLWLLLACSLECESPVRVADDEEREAAVDNEWREEDEDEREEGVEETEREEEEIKVDGERRIR